MKKTIKELYNLIESPFVIDPTITGYPTIEGNESNFLTDYNTYKEDYDRFFVHEYGEMCVDLYSDNDSDAADEFKDELKSILRIYLDSWARLYYALNIDYNPIYNVEEHTETIYGQHVTDHELGQRQHTEGNKSRTFGQHDDTSTGSTWAYDSAAWVNHDKSVDNIGAQTNTEASYTNTDSAVKDTDTSKQHTDTVNRSGNIGIVSATELLEKEEKLRRSYSFFKNCFLTIITEVGGYYECDALF